MRVTDILKDCGIVDTTYFNREARDRGTAVHAGIKLIEEGNPDIEWEAQADPIISGRLLGWRNWRETMPHWKVMEQEFEVRHPVYGYVGHPDILVCNSLDRFEAVIDLKPPGEAPWHGLQLVAYQRAMIAMWKAKSTQQTSAHPPLRRYNLYLGDGLSNNYKLVPRSKQREWNVFYAAYIVAKFKEAK